MNKKKRVVLHIGLPKTATTLLQQHVFIKLNHKFDYVGVRQPRALPQDDIYSKIWNIVCADIKEYQQQFELVKEHLHLRLNSNDRPFLLSEECFCLDAGQISWQEKLKRLANLFKDYDIQVLVTVRHPVSAIFSYYVELYPSIKSDFKTLIDFVNKSNLAKIYNYEYLDTVINNSFGNIKVEYVPFELLERNTFVKEILTLLGITGEVSFDLPNTNSKKKSQQAVKTHNKNVLSFLMFLLRVPIISHFIRLPMIKLMLRKPIKLVQNLKMPFSQSIIQKPNQQEVFLLNVKYSKSISYINSKTNSGYE